MSYARDEREYGDHDEGYGDEDEGYVNEDESDDARDDVHDIINEDGELVAPDADVELELDSTSSESSDDDKHLAEDDESKSQKNKKFEMRHLENSKNYKLKINEDDIINIENRIRSIDSDGNTFLTTRYVLRSVMGIMTDKSVGERNKMNRVMTFALSK